MLDINTPFNTPLSGDSESLSNETPDGLVFVPSADAPEGHDSLTKASLARALAGLMGLKTIDSAQQHITLRPYFVPCETLLAHQATALGITRWQQLFGGVVPWPFVATKVITHALAQPGTKAPSGWCAAFGDATAQVVLEGRSVFSADDAMTACTQLLHGGAVRVKDPVGVGGTGQWVVHEAHELTALLSSMGATALTRHGLVLERNLHRVRTFSVGQLSVGGMRVSYHGQQRLTRNQRDHEVYGGSTLHLVRGGFDALLRVPLRDDVRTAVQQALVYHQAAMSLFPGLFASRCNYDVAQGVDDAGVWHSGVLEQSWRIGGATGAELAGMVALRDEPSLAWVDASTHEVYADPAVAPCGAQVHFDGSDASTGRLLKYATVDACGDA